MRERLPARILVVDDDEDLRGVMVLILRGAGYDVDHAGNGFEALRELDQRGYDLVVSDLDMPGLDGPGLHMEISRRWAVSAPPTLFVSGFADTSTYVGFLNATNAPVLIKPFTLDNLCQLVARLLDGS